MGIGSGGKVLRATLLALFAFATTQFPSLAAPVIQPGVSLDFGGSFCTMNWVYDGPGGPYIGAARHCTTGVGQVVNLSTGSLGTDIQRIGTVAYVSSALDFCLIRVDAGVAPQLFAGMAGHPNIPTGVAGLGQAKRGDIVQYSGHGIVFDFTKATQQQRKGVFSYFDGQGNAFTIGAVTPGDSGGPVADVTAGNKAVGIVDTVGIDIMTPNVGIEGGVAEYALLQDAAANGFPITLRTV